MGYAEKLDKRREKMCENAREWVQFLSAYAAEDIKIVKSQ